MDKMGQYFQYENRLRVRVCGICIENNKILLVKHTSGDGLPLWIPPGGGLEFDENVKSCIEREFLEETGFKVNTGRFLCINEFKEKKLHAIELFFIVSIIGGHLITGKDPEHSAENQLIENVVFLSFEDLQLIPENQLHNMFHGVKNAKDLLKKRGYFHFFGFHSK